MAKFEPLRFHFHATGYALSAHFHRPVDVPIPAQAALALPIEGGAAHSGVDKFEIPRLVSFHSAHTHLSGSYQDKDTTTTSVTVVVEGLSILDFLTVDRMVTRLTSEYELDKKNSENHIIALGSHFDGLKLGGYEVKVTLRHDLLRKSKTFEDLKKGVKNDAKSGKIVVEGDEVLLCSLVEKIETDLPGAEIEGHTITVPHFGKIALAEVFAGRNIRTLTMLRFELGSPDGGGGTSGGGTTNGRPP
ncbi:MAG TPA: hypothetical protein VEI73_15930 [Candidatus Acidoferrum sp.]|nr:hypothetical protein [Candidatus Acidoferrum sp.]